MGYFEEDESIEYKGFIFFTLFLHNYKNYILRVILLYILIFSYDSIAFKEIPFKETAFKETTI
jgi:hypothetical protein